MHWATVRMFKNQWKEAAGWAWRTASNAGIKAKYGVALPAFVDGLEYVGVTTVTVEIPFPTKRRRDPHNYTGTVVKSIIDGLVAVGVWPDDTPEWVKVAEPVLVKGTMCRVHLRWEEQ